MSDVEGRKRKLNSEPVFEVCFFLVCGRLDLLYKSFRLLSRSFETFSFRCDNLVLSCFCIFNLSFLLLSCFDNGFIGLLFLLMLFIYQSRSDGFFLVFHFLQLLGCLFHYSLFGLFFLVSLLFFLVNLGLFLLLFSFLLLLF